MNPIEQMPIRSVTRRRQSLHPSISAEQISELVDRFYGRIFQHPHLGPIFQSHITGDWDTHLEKMKSFWRSVLLRSGEYKGKPVPVHAQIKGIETVHFRQWLDLFSQTAAEVFTQEAAVLVHQAAQRIATSLWLARSQDPFATPPVWTSSDPSIHPATQYGEQP